MTEFRFDALDDNADGFCPEFRESNSESKHFFCCFVGSIGLFGLFLKFDISPLDSSGQILQMNCRELPPASLFDEFETWFST